VRNLGLASSRLGKLREGKCSIVDKSVLASWTIFIVDCGIAIIGILLIYGFLRKQIFALGKWYSLRQNKSHFYQIVVGYILAIVVLVYFRLYVFPENFFIYL